MKIVRSAYAFGEVMGMVGWFAFSGGRRFALVRTQVLGLPLLRLEAPTPSRAASEGRRTERGASLLIRAGCRRVLTAPGFSHWAALERAGLYPVDPEPLVQAMAVPLTLAALARQGVEPRRAAVALRGERVSRAMFEAAQTLCPQVRVLSIVAPSGGEDLRTFLREEYGAADLAAEPAHPDCTLVFSPPRAGESPLPGSGILTLHGPTPYLDGLALRTRAEGLPEGLDPLPVLALLWEEGRIFVRDLEIFPTAPGGICLDSGGQSTYNNEIM